MTMKHIGIACGCFNEIDNLPYFFREIDSVFSDLSDKYTYEIVIADNCSTDGTMEYLREYASAHKNIKVIFNTRNFGASRSGYNALLNAAGDAVVLLATDMQDPPALIPEMIEKWVSGNPIVIAIKTNSEESRLKYAVRSLYYKAISSASNIDLIQHYHGFGLYDRKVLNTIRSLNDPQPYFRGLIADIGIKPAKIEFTQPKRIRGVSKHKFAQLYDEAILGITSYTKLPLRLATFLGFASATISFFMGVAYLIYKLIYWESFAVGSAPTAIGLFFFSSIQLIFLGVMGEYISIIYTHTLKRPPVFELERLNFDNEHNAKE